MVRNVAITKIIILNVKEKNIFFDFFLKPFLYAYLCFSKEKIRCIFRVTIYKFKKQ